MRVVFSVLLGVLAIIGAFLGYWIIAVVLFIIGYLIYDKEREKEIKAERLEAERNKLDQHMADSTRYTSLLSKEEKLEELSLEEQQELSQLRRKLFQ
jgi:flagellar biosynthesis component FlhA